MPRWSNVTTTKSSSSAWRGGASRRARCRRVRRPGTAARGCRAAPADHQREVMPADLDPGQLGDAAGQRLAVRVDDRVGGRRAGDEAQPAPTSTESERHGRRRGAPQPADREAPRVARPGRRRARAAPRAAPSTIGTRPRARGRRGRRERHDAVGAARWMPSTVGPVTPSRASSKTDDEGDWSHQHRPPGSGKGDRRRTRRGARRHRRQSLHIRGHGPAGVHQPAIRPLAAATAAARPAPTSRLSHASRRTPCSLPCASEEGGRELAPSNVARSPGRSSAVRVASDRGLVDLIAVICPSPLVRQWRRSNTSASSEHRSSRRPARCPTLVGIAFIPGHQDLGHRPVAGQHRLSVQQHDDHGSEREQVVLPGLGVGPRRAVHLEVEQGRDEDAAPRRVEHGCQDDRERQHPDDVGAERPGALRGAAEQEGRQVPEPQTAPRIRLAQSGANRRCRSGSATPRQPNSSTGPMSSAIANAGSTAYQGENGKGSPSCR